MIGRAHVDGVLRLGPGSADRWPDRQAGIANRVSLTPDKPATMNMLRGRDSSKLAPRREGKTPASTRPPSRRRIGNRLKSARTTLTLESRLGRMSTTQLSSVWPRLILQNCRSTPQSTVTPRRDSPRGQPEATRIGSPAPGCAARWSARARGLAHPVQPLSAKRQERSRNQDRADGINVAKAGSDSKAAPTTRRSGHRNSARSPAVSYLDAG